ncbi:hypothetical protein Franean1_3151 [Parafrankia sp. EAN1pec]|nr:hypothetical protein Franean1_3151 [Frankia sp. EAN1pec]
MRKWRCRQSQIVVGTATALILVAGCSVEANDESTNPSTGTPAVAPAPDISPGVTANTIKIGFVYPNLSAVKKFINIDHGDYEATFTALVDKVNSSGGINGRKLQPVFGAVDVTSPAGAQETCLKLTQDEKVFAVLGSLSGDEPLCYIQTHRTALVGGTLSPDRYAKAQAPWFSYQRGGDEAAEGIKLFAADGGLDGKVAIVSSLNEEGVMKTAIMPALKELGITPVAAGVLDAPATDPAAVAQQLNVFVQKFQSAGADTVIVVGGVSSEFPKSLEKTDYRPKLLFSEINQAELYSNDPGEHDFSTLKDAAAVGLGVNWNDPANLECVNTLVAAHPDLKETLIDPNDVESGEPQLGVSAGIACSSLALFTAIAEKAGGTLSYKTFQDAAFSLGSFHVPGFMDDATYGPSTPDGRIPPRLFEYSATEKNFKMSTG